MTTAILAAILLLAFLGFALGRRRAVTLAGGNWRNLHSLPSYYGAYVALWCGVPALAIFAAWLAFEPHILEAIVVRGLPAALAAGGPAQTGLLLNDIRNIAAHGVGERSVDPALIAAAEQYKRLQSTAFGMLAVVALAAATLGLGWAQRRVAPGLRARNRVERAVLAMLLLSSTLSILTTVGIVLSLLFESLRFFHAVPFWDFLFGLEWSPQTALRADQVGSSGAFGAIPLFAGTLLITAIAMAVAVPVGLLVAIYLADYASRRGRALIKPVLEVLAGIPTVVYGFFAALTMAPFIRGLGEAVGLTVASESALAAGLVMGIMIVPFVSSLSDDVMNAVPQSLRDGSYALGATKSETIRQVVIPAALPGIVGGVLLAVSRAVGETMIVVMAAGLSANLTVNPLEAVTTVTVQIATLLVGDQEFDSAKTLAAFALGLVLFFATLSLNLVALHVVRKYREKYD
ncbi:MAG: phosphate ABC transporter permease subunit PstC [Pseudomonadota bacterium]